MNTDINRGDGVILSGGDSYTVNHVDERDGEVRLAGIAGGAIDSLTLTFEELDRHGTVYPDGEDVVDSVEELDEGARYQYAGNDKDGHTFRVVLEWANIIELRYADGYVAEVPRAVFRNQIAVNKIQVVEEAEGDDEPELVTDGGQVVEEDAEAPADLVDAVLAYGRPLDLDGLTFAPATAVMYLNSEFDGSAFPIRDERRSRWIVEAESDSLDGRRFVSKFVTVEEDGEECPECGNTRERRAYGTNGVVEWHRETCTVCGFVHSEDAG